MSVATFTLQQQSREVATENIDLQSLKYLLSGSWQKKFANLCSRLFTTAKTLATINLPFLKSHSEVYSTNFCITQSQISNYTPPKKSMGEKEKNVFKHTFSWMHFEFPELIGTANEMQTPWIIIRILLERWVKTTPAGVNEKPSVDNMTH